MFCGTPLPSGKIQFRDLCPSCGKELHICRHCRFYKPGAYRDCAETVPEEVSDKESRNFCEYFCALDSLPGDSGKGKTDSARSAFEGLFS